MKESSRQTNLRSIRVTASRLAELLKPFRSGWVALSADEQEVIASGATLHKTREQTMKRHISDAVFVKVIPPGQGYLPPCSEVFIS